MAPIDEGCQDKKEEARVTAYCILRWFLLHIMMFVSRETWMDEHCQDKEEEVSVTAYNSIGNKKKVERNTFFNELVNVDNIHESFKSVCISYEMWFSQKEEI